MSRLKKQTRNIFRARVFTRDRYECKICGYILNLDAHHITNRNEMPNGGYVLENGITLCPEHHILAEYNVLPADYLYTLIGSSYEEAVERSTYSAVS